MLKSNIQYDIIFVYNDVRVKRLSRVLGAVGASTYSMLQKGVHYGNYRRESS